MKIGISQSTLSTEGACYYVEQLGKEGHEIKKISEIDPGNIFDMYICDNVESLVSFLGKIKYLLFFSTLGNRSWKESKEVIHVNSWWEIYNYIRYEI